MESLVTATVRGPVVLARVEAGVAVADACAGVVLSPAGAGCAAPDNWSEFDDTSAGSSGSEAQALVRLAPSNTAPATAAHLVDLLIIRETILSAPLTGRQAVALIL
jgi:hypothetical protein